MLLPGSVFSYGTRHVRLGFGREDLPEVVARFAEYLTAWFRQTKAGGRIARQSMPRTISY